MMKSDQATNTEKALPEERRLLWQATSGSADAFVRLYDAYVERVYRYIYFRVSDDIAAETITSRVFIQAWENLGFYPIFVPSFFNWLCKIARNQVKEHYNTHKRLPGLDPSLVLVTGETGGLDQRVQDIFDLQAMRDALQFLTEEQRQVLILKYIAGLPAETIARIMVRRDTTIRSLEVSALQVLARIEARKDTEHMDFKWILEDCLAALIEGRSTVEECLRRYPEYAAQLRPLLRTVLFLNLARSVKPSAAYSASMRADLIEYLRFHGRRPFRLLTLQRVAVTAAVVLAALVATSTARAQTALPGDPLYGWKRTSEHVWRAASIDPVETDLVLANRRMDEWLATRHDPERSASALDGYSEVITRLEASQNVETIQRVVPVIETHQQILEDAGLATSDLGNYVAAELATLPAAPSAATSTTAAQPAVQPTANPPAVSSPVPAVPTPGESSGEPAVIPTELPPVLVPTSVPATPIPPTPVPPTPIPPTSAPPTANPTAISVVPTQVPTDAPGLPAGSPSNPPAGPPQQPPGQATPTVPPID